MNHHFMLPRFNPSALCRLREVMAWALCVIVQVSLSGEDAKNDSWRCLSSLRGWGSMTMAFLGKLAYTWLTILSCHVSISDPYVIERDGGLSTLCHLCQLVCQQRLLKICPSFVYLHFKDEVVWLWHFWVNFHLHGPPILSFNHSIPVPYSDWKRLIFLFFIWRR